MNIKLTLLDFSLITALLVYSASATVTPICLLAMADELHFNLSASGGIEGMRSILIFASLFSGGFIASRIGKIRSLAGGLFGLSIGYAVYAAAPSYAAILGASVLIGASCGILEGLINPLVQDLHSEDSGRYLNITNSAWSAGVLSTVLIAGELLTRDVSWRLIMAALSFFSFTAGVFMALLRKREPHTKALNTESVIRFYIDCIRSKRFLVFCFMMFLAGGAEGAFTFWSASYIQLHFASLPRMGAVGTACFAAGMLSMRLFIGVYVPQHKLRKMIFLSAAGGFIIAALLPLMHSQMLFFPALFLSGVAIACFWPSIQSYAVYKIPRLDSTSAFILMSCAGIPGFGLIPFIMGIIGDTAGLEKSFLLIPPVFALLAVTVIIEKSR
ncbi:MFS transporter [Treponema sp. HNW]|uniref:MFS transporter n=1 Tax=Treponema sp. HNW TaxID=3116654 RepID=UPI003D09CFAC